MSDCADFRDRVHEWVDGELDREPAAAAARHVEACPQCAEVARSIRSLKSLVRAKASAVVVPDRLAARVRETIALEALRAGRGRVLRVPVPRGRWLAAAALIIIAIPIAALFIRPRDLHAEVTRGALESHKNSVVEEDLPRFRCMSKEEAELSLTEHLGYSVSLPDFCRQRTCVRGVSIQEFGGVKVGKVFYRLDDAEFSVFVVPPEMRRGSHLCRCHEGHRLHVFCTREESHCLIYVTELDRDPFASEILEPALRRSIPPGRKRSGTGEGATPAPAVEPAAPGMGGEHREG